MPSEYTKFVKKHFASVQRTGLTAPQTISAIAKMWRAQSGSPRSSSRKSPVYRRCSAKKVSACHKKKRICSQNTKRTRCRRSASYRKSR